MGPPLTRSAKTTGPWMSTPHSISWIQPLLKSNPTSHDTQGRTLFHQTFHAESYNVASILLDCGADIHAQLETGGWQPIHYAALSRNARAVQLCLHHGADPNARTQDMQTTLAATATRKRSSSFSATTRISWPLMSVTGDRCTMRRRTSGDRE